MAFDAIAVKQAKQILVSGEDASISVSFDSPVSAGSMLVLIGTGNNTVSYQGVLLNSVSGGGSWSTPTNVRAAGAYAPNVFAAQALNVSAGSPTVTLTMDAAAGVQVSGVLFEIEKAVTTDAVDKTMLGTGPTAGNTTTLPTTGPLTQTDNLLILCVGGYFGIPVNPSGWVSQLSQQNGALIGCQVSTLKVTATTAVVGEVTGESAGVTSGTLLVIKAATTGAGPTYEFTLRSDTFTSADTGLEAFVWRNGDPDAVLAERYTSLAGDAVAGKLKITTGLPAGVSTGDTIRGLVRVVGGVGDTSGIIAGTVV
jgi:hypothetical protein